MSLIVVRGCGAVSPAGWGIAAFREALAKGEPLETKPLIRPGWLRALPIRPVPPSPHRPGFMAHARLRRASAISQYAVAAALEALGSDLHKVSEGAVRLGVICCVLSGGVNYSSRFYSETLENPIAASPLLFPETVFNAPASHVAALLGTTEINYTLVGDSGTFLLGLALAAEWLSDGQVDGCVVVGAEERDWLTVDAFHRFERKITLSDGAGALYLSRGVERDSGVQLSGITDAHSFLQKRGRVRASRAMRAQLPDSSPNHLLCDGTQQLSRLDAAEIASWADWTGPRLSPKEVFGEGLAASGAWQCVAAIDALRENRYAAANVSVVGCNQQAIGAHFVNLNFCADPA